MPLIVVIVTMIRGNATQPTNIGDCSLINRGLAFQVSSCFFQSLPHVIHVDSPVSYSSPTCSSRHLPYFCEAKSVSSQTAKKTAIFHLSWSGAPKLAVSANSP
jgi:hypothetical protein